MVNRIILIGSIFLLFGFFENCDHPFGKMHVAPIVQVEFREFGANLEIVTELDIYMDKQEVDLYYLGELYYSGILSTEMESEIIKSIERIERIHLDKIYNVNSADNSIFEITFWGENSDYAHMIKLFGSNNAPQSVKETVSILRESARKVGMLKGQ
ncbi:MAG: hypothetical protein WA004_18740 [Saprospiraceae bacterium]